MFPGRKGEGLKFSDEPTGNLDSVTGMEVTGLLKSCSQRFHQTVLVVTHQEEVAQAADRIVRLEDGQICGDSGGHDSAHSDGHSGGHSMDMPGKEQVL